MSENNKKKWHKRHVTIDTPCHIAEIEGIIQAIANAGGWCDATVTVDDDRIVITFGDEDESDEAEMKPING